VKYSRAEDINFEICEVFKGGGALAPVTLNFSVDKSNHVYENVNGEISYGYFVGKKLCPGFCLISKNGCREKKHIE
jgi:hypothetical protein